MLDVSVIIPNYNGLQFMEGCLDALKRQNCQDFEILVVDNGSSEENRKLLQRKVSAYNTRKKDEDAFQGITYYYEPMQFNFSRMCNLGAKRAKGDLLLFLNDDMEVIAEDWLSLMADKALLSYAGAVGAKLLYPDSTVIRNH